MNGGRGVRNLEFVLHHTQEMLRTRTSQEANDIVANSRKNPLEAWRRLHERCDPTVGGRKRNILRAIFSPGRCSLQELQAGSERWVSKVVRCEKLKGKLDDEIKRVSLESLVPEETFEDLYSEVVKYMEEKFGLRIRDFQPNEVSFRESSDSTDLMLLALLCRAKENGHRIRAVSFLRLTQHIFSETAMQLRTWASKRLAKAIRASHGP